MVKIKKWFWHLSLQWRLTLLCALVVSAACILLTSIIGASANTKMDEIGDFAVGIDNIVLPEGVSLEDIEIIPEYSQMLEDSKHDFQFQSLLAMLAVILSSSVLTYFVAGRALSQLHLFSEQIERVQAQNLSSPLDFEDFPSEVRRLSHSFNEMLGRLEEAFSAQKQFSANAAHELRTPLAVMQTKIEVFQKTEEHTREEYEQMLALLEKQTDRLAHIISELLELTELQSAQLTDRIALGELVEEIFCDLECQAAPKGIELLQAPGTSVIPGNETLIYRALFNLIDNAIKYNQPDGTVTISISETDGMACVSIADTGIGIPKEYQEQIFEPFFRVDKSRSRKMGGAGIGLAMVRSIAELHGGTVFVEKSEPGNNVITLRLPVRQIEFQ